MCGIAGYMGLTEPSQENVSDTMEVLKNRGPDYRGCCHIKPENELISLTLIHTRLAIIDLDPRANQPFKINGFSIVFNGEIYNYLELRHELISEGYEFHTNSDTEVLLTAYIHFGLGFVDKLEGMWSFGLWDPRKQLLILSRDRFGEKPLYYRQDESGLYFASEVKAITSLSGSKPAINFEQVLRYNLLGYKSLYKKDQTYFSGIREVPNACTITVGMDMRISENRYWRPEFGQVDISLADAIDGARHFLTESVRLRMRSDVPVAFCLSGGVDSAALTSIASKTLGADVNTFSIIDSDPRYNEYENIMHTVADLGCNHHIVRISESSTIDRLKEQIAYHDAPIATISYFVHSLLSEKMSENGFKVAFSGTAADELFTGYYDHFLLHLYQLRNHKEYQQCRNDWQTHISGFVRNPALSDPDLYIKNPGYRDHVFDNASEFRTWLNPEHAGQFDLGYTEETYCESLLRNRMLNELFHEATPVILHEDDMNSMRHSVENRSPYLDTGLFDFVYSLPEEFLIREGYGKYLLREAVKGILNDKVRLDRRKKGFNASIHSIVDFQDRNVRDEFLDPSSEIFRYIDHGKVMGLVDEPGLPNHYSKFLFSLINTQIFIGQFQ